MLRKVENQKKGLEQDYVPSFNLPIYKVKSNNDKHMQ